MTTFKKRIPAEPASSTGVLERTASTNSLIMKELTKYSVLVTILLSIVFLAVTPTLFADGWSDIDRQKSYYEKQLERATLKQKYRTELSKIENPNEPTIVFVLGILLGCVAVWLMYSLLAARESDYMTVFLPPPPGHNPELTELYLRLRREIQDQQSYPSYRTERDTTPNRKYLEYRGKNNEL